MTGWADEIAADFVSKAKSQTVWQDEIAAALRKARHDALEEAAKHMETRFALGVGDYAAVKIRALKDTET